MNGAKSTPVGAWRPVLAAGVLYAVVICVVAAIRAESTSDFRDFWLTARHFLETGQISSRLGVHNYLPTFPMLMTPLALLPLRVAIVIFTLVSIGLFACAVVLTERILNGGLAQRPRPAMLAAVGLMLAYVTSCGVLGALGLVLTFLVVLSWRLALARRDWVCGLILGLATVLKLLPAVLIVFFLLKRRLRIVGAAVGTIVFLALGLPAAVLGIHQTRVQYRDYYERAFLAHSAHTTIHADRPIKANYSNNALPITLRRLLSPVVAGKRDGADEGWTVNIASLPRGVIWWIYVVLMSMFVFGSAATTLTNSPAGGPSDRETDWELSRQFGLWCCLMLLASPLVWTHYLPLVYFPLAWLCEHGVRTHAASGRSSRGAAAALLIWLACVLLLAWNPARAAGAQMLSVVVLWCALFGRVRVQRATGSVIPRRPPKAADEGSGCESTGTSARCETPSPPRPRSGQALRSSE